MAADSIINIVGAMENSYARSEAMIRDLVLIQFELKTQLWQLKKELLGTNGPDDIQPPTPLVDQYLSITTPPTDQADTTSEETSIKVEQSSYLSYGKESAGASCGVENNEQESSESKPKCVGCDQMHRLPGNRPSFNCI